MFHVKQPLLVEYAEKLQVYAALLRRYHSALDLMSSSAVTALEAKIAEARRYPELIAAQLSPTERILDLGSGAGLPGVPLALAFPGHAVTWVERRQRRANFLKIVASQLELKNVTVVADDVRQFVGAPHSWVCAQAVGRLPLLYCLTRHLHAEQITLVTRRADLSPAETAQLEAIAGPVLGTASAALPTHGKLVALRFQGGRPCPSSV
jgi:16S rRNA (guanine527-N7)-methyltransferase